VCVETASAGTPAVGFACDVAPLLRGRAQGHQARQAAARPTVASAAPPEAQSVQEEWGSTSERLSIGDRSDDTAGPTDPFVRDRRRL
jgi:hypothetical protein